MFVPIDTSRWFVTLCIGLLSLALIAQEREISAIGHVPLHQISNRPSFGNDVWGFNDSSGRAYAIFGTSTGTTVFDLGDPANPREVGTIPGEFSYWRDAKTFTYGTGTLASTYAFVTTDRAPEGLLILDLSGLPNRIREAGRYRGFDTAHNIFIPIGSNQPFAYVGGSDRFGGGLIILDIANPTAPRIAGVWDDFYVHDMFVSNLWADPRYAGKDVCIAFCGANNVSILDVSDKANPKKITDFTYDVQKYAHSGWVTEDGRYLYLFDEQDELKTAGLPTTIRVFDLIDMQHPVQVQTWLGPSNATDHNGFIKGNLLYLANYSRGFLLLDISDPTAAVLLDEVDTFPEHDNPSYNGAWGCFPFYEQDMVAIGDVDSGFYLFRTMPLIHKLQTSAADIVLCQQRAEVDIARIDDSGLSGEVHVTFTGLPPGLRVEPAAFSLAPQQSRTIGLIAEPGAEPGIYGLNLVSTGTGSDVQEKTLRIEIGAGVETKALPLLPDNGRDTVEPVNLRFAWQAAGLLRRHRFELAETPEFEPLVFSVETEGVAIELPMALERERVFYWRVASEDPCGEVAQSPIQRFLTGGNPVLLVDDDDGTPDTGPSYEALLTGLGVDFDRFDSGGGGGDGPSATDLEDRALVMWFSGDQYAVDGTAAAGPNGDDEILLDTYLAGGGSLFLSSQDYVRDRGGQATPLLRDWLGVDSIRGDVTPYNRVIGTSDLASLGSLDLEIGNLQFFPDWVSPGGQGETILADPSSGEGAAVRSSRGWFFGFPFSTLIEGEPAAAREIARGVMRTAIGKRLPSGGPYRQYVPLNPGHFLAQSFLTIIGPEAGATQIEVLAIAEDGFALKRRLPYLAPRGLLRLDLGQIFAARDWPFNWIAVSSDRPVLVYFEGRGEDQAFAIPAADRLTERLIVPHIAADTAQFFTAGNFINGSESALDETLQTPDGSVWQFSGVAPLAGRFLDFETQFENQVGSLRTSAVLYADSAALAGAEVFGYENSARMAGLTLTGETSTLLTFSHIADVANGWWTGLAVVNPGEVDTILTVTGYDGAGTEIITNSKPLAAGGKIVALVDSANRAEALVPAGLPGSVVWIEIRSDQPVTGYALFGDLAERQFAGFQAGRQPARDVVFPNAGDGDHYAALAMVNPFSHEQNLDFHLYAADGRLLSVAQRPIGPKARLITLATGLFPELPKAAAYLRVQADSGIFGFELYGPLSSAWLCGLNALEVPVLEMPIQTRSAD